MCDESALLFCDGTSFSGRAFGARFAASGRPAVFGGAVGLQEFLTDPASAGLVVIASSPLTGNCGFNLEDMESDDCYASALVTRERCVKPGGWRCELELDAFLRRTGTAGLEGADTREITRLCRGGMREVCVGEGFPPAPAKRYRAARQVTSGNGPAVALIDIGARKSVTARLREPGTDAFLRVFPADCGADEVAESDPEYVIISNGPGEPEDYPEIVELIRAIRSKERAVTVMGMGLGAVLLGLALGACAAPLERGHHSPSVTVKGRDGGLCVTEQNHRHTLINLPEGVTPRYVNVNDGTLEGFSAEGAYGVMFYPAVTRTHSRSPADFYEMIAAEQTVS